MKGWHSEAIPRKIKKGEVRKSTYLVWDATMESNTGSVR